MVMKIDTKNKNIILEDSVNYNEFILQIDKMLGEEKKDYNILVNPIIINTTTITPSNPFIQPYQYPQEPFFSNPIWTT